MKIMRLDRLKWHDILLVAIITALAACGLIYEYILAQYAGRILGSLESTIYSMIGLMIVAMGIGAFFATSIRSSFTGFAWLESVVAAIGCLSILVMAITYALSYTLQEQLNTFYESHPTIPVGGSIPIFLETLSSFIPYIVGFILGLLIGIEVPLIARVREKIHARYLEHNFGTIYGADYIGAGIGAGIWVMYCLNAPILQAALFTALTNVIIGIVFLFVYHKDIKGTIFLWPIYFVILSFIALLFIHGERWMSSLNNMLYQDTVVHRELTQFQNIVITKKVVSNAIPTVYKLYLNNRLQFSSADEKIYHAMLTYPALLASARQNNILIVGGGDGLALRDILRWKPKQVTLLELDPAVISLFSGKSSNLYLNQVLLNLNRGSLLDDRVNIIYGDAFVNIKKLVEKQFYFDSIIIDLPDPSHPDLNKLYSDLFYASLKSLLNADGTMVIQSSSPYHSKKAFISVGKTLEVSGFITQQYHSNIPSFGEWGWTIGTISGDPPSKRVESADLLVKNDWISKNQILAAFSFSPSYFKNRDKVKVNQSDSHTIYQYHFEAWVKNKGVFHN